MRIEQPTNADFYELMDFLVVAFHSPFRFETQFPDLYLPDEELMRNILVIRENGRIVSSLGIFPLHLRVGGLPVVSQGIGGVCTHPSCRGKSMMSLLLDESTRVISERHAPFAWLGGFRYRYGRWGWERAGTALNMTLTEKNIPAAQSSDHKVIESKVEELPWHDILNLRKSERIRGDAPREELRRKYERPLVKVYLASKDESPAAFAVMQGNQLAEFGGDPQGIVDIVLHLLKNTPAINLEMPSEHSASLAALAPLFEDVKVVSNANYAVVDLRACLELAVACAPGDLGIGGVKGVNIHMNAGKQFEQEAFIGIENGKAVAGEARKGSFTITADPMRAAALVFGPLKPSLLLGAQELRWLDLVLPLPAYVPKLYHV